MQKSDTRAPRGDSIIANTIKSISTVVAAAMIAATLFTAATPGSLFSGELSAQLAEALRAQEQTEANWPTATPRPKPPIGIVVGHWGDSDDPGAICPDGLTELSINEEIAALVQKELDAEGFDVDLLKEFDFRLEGYHALALVSIHADSCQYINDQATGFKVAASVYNPRPERTARLEACLVNRYARVTGLQEHAGITEDMSGYHAFEEIGEDTPAVIIETGFMNLDRQMLTQNSDQIAHGIADGILCYIRNESVSAEPAADEP
jgi:N-acetylmuramoyl-L-alanine amidase